MPNVRDIKPNSPTREEFRHTQRKKEFDTRFCAAGQMNCVLIFNAVLYSVECFANCASFSPDTFSHEPEIDRKTH